jgi:hypothetical protein
MLPRLAYLGVTNAFALLRLMPRSDHDSDTEILVLRHRLTVLQRQPDGQCIQFRPTDRALLAALLHPLPWAAHYSAYDCWPTRHHPALAPQPARPPHPR